LKDLSNSFILLHTLLNASRLCNYVHVIVSVLGADIL